MKSKTGYWFQGSNLSVDNAEFGLRLCLNHIEFCYQFTYWLIVSESGFGIFRPEYAPPHICLVYSFVGSDLSKFHTDNFLVSLASRISHIQPQKFDFKTLYFRRFLR